MRNSTRRALVLFAAALAPAAASAAWRAEGPFQGNVSQVAIAASRPQTVYAATSGGGVWRSDDGGSTWKLPGDEMTNRDVQWVAVDPVDPASVWAGLDASGSGSALWRSKDGGATWAAVADSFPGGRVHATGAPIAFAPTQPKTIYVASSNLHYRTDDGGKTWRDFRVPNQDAYVFAVHPKDPKIVYAGGRGDSLNLSRSSDGGKTWKQIGIGLGKNSLHTLLIDPSTPTTLYASGGTFTSIFKSTDQGENWSELKLPVGGTSDLYSLTLDPTSGVLWAATEDGLLKSSDGGASWTKSDEGSGRYYLKTIAIDPRDSSHLLAGAGGDGIHRSVNGGASWTPSSEGLSAGWTEKLWGDSRSATLFVRMSAGFFRRDSAGGTSWTEITDPFATDAGKVDIDGFLFDASSPQSVYAFDTSKYWHSTDGGKRWQEVEQKGPSMRDMMKGNTESAQFASLVQETGNAKVLYAGSWSNDSPGGAVYKTTDGGKKWAPAGNGLPGDKVGMLRVGAPGTVFALVEEKALYRTTNGGGSWAAAGSGLPDGKIHELAVNPKNPTQLFAATEKGLFRSSDSGASWSRVANGIEGDDVQAVAVDAASGAVFAGTFHGAFRSGDGGDSWKAFNDGLAHQDVRALAIAGTPPRLWAGTAGGSVYSTELP
jgi:photosystem II stability/assembly factor-like uncharacterized protein